MIGQITLTGMILGAMPIGEYDKRVVILTGEKGRITAFAKGARRQNSSLLACSQPFSFGQFTVYEGRNSYNLVNADISNYFMDLRNDIEKVTYGMLLLEMADYYTKENQDEKEVLRLLYQSCRALETDSISNKLVRMIFELKLVALNGEISTMRECFNCGSDTDLVGASIERGQMVCSSCMSATHDIVKLSNTAIYTIQYIIFSSIEKLFSFTVTDDVLDELIRFTKIYLKKCVDKQFKSLEMLELLNI